MKIPHYTMIVGGAAIAAVGVLVALGAGATHSWGNYHWARTADQFTLKLGDNVSREWDAYLEVASADWNASSVLKTIIVTGGTRPKTCKPAQAESRSATRNTGVTDGSASHRSG